MAWDFTTSSGAAKTGEVTSDVPVGTIVKYGASTAPAGWYNCDGTAISRTGYAALFSAIGTTYGPGDGSTTFNVPDFRGRVGMGSGTGLGAITTGGAGTAPSGAALTARAAGSWSGRETHTLDHTTEVGIPPHAHADTISYGGESGHTHDISHGHADNITVNKNVGSGSNANVLAVTAINGVTAGVVTNATTGGVTAFAGSSGGSTGHTHTKAGGVTSHLGTAATPHNNIQPYLVVNHIIKAVSQSSASVVKAGSEPAGGYFEKTTDTSTPPGGAVTTIGSITVTGDGVTPMMISTFVGGVYNNTLANSYINLYIYDGAVLVQSARTWCALASTAYSVHGPQYRVAPFSGTKTFNFRVASDIGQGVAQTQGTPTFIRATWAG
jgi:microcystin-dependent protein